MKKVLILAYDFPPYVSVGGLRPYAWLKYLPEYGIEPIVVTRSWSNDFGNGLDYIAPSASDEVELDEMPRGLVIRTPYIPNLSNRLLLKHGAHRFRLLRKSLTAWSEITQFLWVTGTKKELYYAADEYLEEYKVDAIIATGDPFILFDFARKLSVKYDIPWIADYRDPWSATDSGHSIWDSYSRFWEKRIVNDAALITTVSSPISKLIGSIVEDKEIRLLPNGFDPEVLDSIASIEQNSEILTISLAGSLYGWHPWKQFLKVVNDFVGLGGHSLRIKFYGVNIQSDIEAYLAYFIPSLVSKVEFIPRLENEDLLRALRQDNVLLLFNDYSIQGTKVYDYIGVKRKIILCFENDRSAQLLKEQYFSFSEELYGVGQLQLRIVEETKSGVIVEHEEHLLEVLADLHREFIANKQIACDSEGVEKYSRKIQVKRLAELITQITSVG